MNLLPLNSRFEIFATGNTCFQYECLCRFMVLESALQERKIDSTSFPYVMRSE